MQPGDEKAGGPRHVAIIMDGNGRWAKARGLPRTVGHRQGVEAVKRTVEAAGEFGVPYLTLFGFSAENWGRPAEEVSDLMGLLRLYLRSETAELHRNRIRLRVIGDRSRFDDDILALIDQAETLTAGNSRHNLTVALGYGGRQDLTDAVRDLAQDAKAGRIDPSAIDEAALSGRLSTRALPAPDLLIRTSGEKRISNFLLWEIAYTELVFLDVLWPEFGRDDFAGALDEFQTRDRRYGVSVGL